MDRSVMSQPRSVNRRLLLALACFALLASALVTGTAQASYGQLGKPFGEKGKQLGQFTYSSEVHAFGVDPTDNSVYVGDEPVPGSETVSEYRVQKFVKGIAVASASFKVKAEAKAEGGNPVGIEGIAVDPKLGRVYALVVYEREEEEGEKREKENVKLEKEGKSPIPKRIDGEIEAAGTLYAFSTTPTGKELVPAPGTTEGGVLASKVTLAAQSEVAAQGTGSALLEPSGIAVDPTNGDVIILGEEDQGEEALLAAAQRVKSNGTLGPRWVDSEECFEGEEGGPKCFEESPESEEAFQPGEPQSPVVTKDGRVLVDVQGGEIWEIPKGFVSGEAPEPIIPFANPLQKILSFPGAPDSNRGGSLAYVYETGEPETGGKLYQAAERIEVLGGKQTGRYPAILAFQLSASGGSLLGWTGGGNAAQEKETPCAISVFTQPLIGAGTGETVFVFDANKTVTEPPNPHVVTFAPGGSHCPTASAEVPTATANGTAVGTTANPARPNEKITLSSQVSGANALSVQWSFDEVAEAPEGQEFQTTKTEHAFATTGEHTVKEVIKTDDLGDPTLEVSAKIVVAVAKPVASFSISPANPTVDAPVKFTSTSPVEDENKSKLVKYVWSFGDGATAETTTATPVEHTYGTAGKFHVTLQVTDALGGTGTSLPKEITVAGQTTTTTTTTTTTAATTPPPTTTATPNPTSTPPGPGQQVLGTTTTKGNPEAKLAGTSVTVSASGSFTVKVSCPAGETSCAGTISLRTASAVKASAKSKAAILTLASGSFTVSGGASKALTLHLSSKARALLARSHVLRARATLLAHDATGASRTTQATVTLKPAKKAHH
jgi:hypothetical protein